MGLMGFLRLPVRGYPNINLPTILITTDYAGASASVIESQITNPIENDIIGASGIDTMHSTSTEGMSKVVVQYKLGIDIDAAVNDIRNRLAYITAQIPKDATAPVIEKDNPDNTQTLILGLTDPHLNDMDLTDYSNRYIVPAIEQILGVAEVDIYNERDYAMRILLDPTKMVADHVTVNDLTNVLQTQNTDVASGEIKSPSRYYSVLSAGQLNTIQGFKNLIIRDQNNYLLRFADVANVQVAPADTDNTMRIDGQDAVGLGIYAQDNANPIEVSQKVKNAIPEIQNSLPAGMKLQVFLDNTDFLKAALHGVYHDLALAIILVTLVVTLFLGSMRTLFIPFLTIPICLIGVFALMYMLGYSINIFTLLAFVLAIGLVVDDAIVMLENIYRHLEEGASAFQAAIAGSREIVFAIIAMTLTLAAVYAPIGFAVGMTGIIFREFAFTLALAVIISGFVALTLSPMMCSRLLSLPQTQSGSTQRYHAWLDRGFAVLIAQYRKILIWFLRHRLWTVFIILVVCVLGYFSFKNLSFVLEPKENSGMVMTNIQQSPNASFAYLNKESLEVENMLHTIPEVSKVLAIIDSQGNGPMAYVDLKANTHASTVTQILNEISQKAKALPGVNLYAFNMSQLGGGGRFGDAIRMMIASDESFDQLNQTAQSFIDTIKKYPGIMNPTQDLQMNSKEYVVHIKKDLASAMSVDIGDINNTLKTMLDGSQVTQFYWNNYEYQVILQLPQNSLQDLSLINELYVRNTQGQMIPLSTLVTVDSDMMPQELPHDGRLRAVTITAQVAPRYNMGQDIDYLTQTAKKVLPAGYQYQFRGAAKNMQESRYTMIGSFTLAIVFIYLVLAAQFESFLDPMIILLSVPLSIIGAIFTLRLTGQVISIYAEIGFITLVGLIAKHGILITEFANQMRRNGKSLQDALIDAASLRLRPILMTTAAMVLGALPLALAQGAGALSRQQIGSVIVGGLLFGTFFSLIVVPVAYSFFSKYRKNI